MSGALPITIYFCLVGQRHTLLNRIVFLVSCCGYYCCLLRLFGWWCFIIFSTTIVSLFSLAVSSPAVRAINFNLKHIFIFEICSWCVRKQSKTAGESSSPVRILRTHGKNVALSDGTRKADGVKVPDGDNRCNADSQLYSSAVLEYTIVGLDSK